MAKIFQVGLTKWVANNGSGDDSNMTLFVQACKNFIQTRVEKKGQPMWVILSQKLQQQNTWKTDFVSQWD